VPVFEAGIDRAGEALEVGVVDCILAPRLDIITRKKRHTLASCDEVTFHDNPPARSSALPLRFLASCKTAFLIALPTCFSANVASALAESKLGFGLDVPVPPMPFVIPTPAPPVPFAVGGYRCPFPCVWVWGFNSLLNTGSDARGFG